MAAPTFRTNDGTRWGTGQGSDLSAQQIDLNFWDLYSSLLALEGHQSLVADIDFISATGDQMFVHLTNHRVVGPITIPTSQWNFRSGGWTPATHYAAFDVFSFNGSVYLVLVAHNSAATFDPGRNDGDGHDFYALLISSPTNALPQVGTPGQRLALVSESPFITEWRGERVRIGLTVVGKPDANELLFQYAVVDNLRLPVGLTGSVAHAGTISGSDVSYPLQLNGAAIGSIDFAAGSPTPTVNFTANVNMVPGDILTLFGPASPDASQADISFTFVATITA